MRRCADCAVHVKVMESKSHKHSETRLINRADVIIHSHSQLCFIQSLKFISAGNRHKSSCRFLYCLKKLFMAQSSQQLIKTQLEHIYIYIAVLGKVTFKSNALQCCHSLKKLTNCVT